jgi:uncharacterized protein
MKNIVLTLVILFSIMSQAQESKPLPLISVSGEGKIKVAPDQAQITISLETKGNVAVDVKKENDSKIDAVLKFIKKMNIAKEDFQTQRVSLNPNYDYEKKKHNYIANQTIVICLKDLNKYDELMDGLVTTGINRIDNVEFKTSKMLQIQSDARKLAIKDAKAKANDYVFELGQKVGKAFSITDNSQPLYQPMVSYNMKVASADAGGAPNETLAAGMIEVIVNVSVSFLLE